MRTKLEAVRQVSELGVVSIIARGKTPTILERVFAGDKIGTWFDGKSKPMGCRKHWIAYASGPEGKIIVDDGAVQAIQNKGRSLLPIGITAVDGDFDIGAPVDICSPSGVAIARGLVSCSSQVLMSVMGKHSADVDDGVLHTDEIIHRDDMTLLDGLVGA